MVIEALNHLSVLELDGFVVVQLKKDNDQCTVREKPLKGRYCDLEPTLLEMNKRGAAIFVQVQGGKGRGQKNIDRVRWLYVDLDNVNELPRFPFEPHLIVRTPRGFHVYWRIRHSKKLGLWKRVEARLCELLNGDPGVKAISQVLRLAGYDHQKREPFMIDIEAWEPNRSDYRLERLAHELRVPIDDVASRKTVLGTGENVPIGKDARRRLFPIVRNVLDQQVSRVAQAERGTRHVVVRNAAFCLGHYYHWGMNLEIAEDRMLNEIENRKWPEFNRKRSTLRNVVREGLLAGRLAGPPDASPSLAEDLIRCELGEKLRAKIFLEAESFPVKTTTRKMRAFLGEQYVSAAWGSGKQASHQIGRALMEVGYKRSGRSNGETVFERYFGGRDI